MGLDATIKRPDGKPLGKIEKIQKALQETFPGIVLGMLPSGAEKIRAAEEQGIVFPDVIRQSLESTPAKHGGEYEGPEFSAQFDLGPSNVVQSVSVMLYGTTTASEAVFAILEERYGWIATFP